MKKPTVLHEQWDFECHKGLQKGRTRNEHETLDGQNTSVNMQTDNKLSMRRTSSFRSIKSNSDGLSADKNISNTIQFDSDIDSTSIKEVLRCSAFSMGWDIAVVTARRILITTRPKSFWGKLSSWCMGGENSGSVLISAEFKKEATNNKCVLILKLINGKSIAFQRFQRQLQYHLSRLEPTGNTSTMTSNISNIRKESFLQQPREKGIQNSPFKQESRGYQVVQTILKKKYLQSIQKLTQFINSQQKKVLDGSLHQNELVNEVLRTLNKIYQQVQISLPDCNYDVIYYSIEKFICLSCLPLVLEVYKEKLKRDEQIFQQRKKRIIEEWNDKQIIQYLQIKPQFQLLPETSQSQHTPYFSAINKLSSLEFSVSLRQKMKVVQEYYSAVKVCCYQFHKGKLEIATMDDILPVIILTVLKAKVNNFYAQLKMVDDYARACSRFQGDQRILTNLFVGLEYISKQWTLQ